MTHHATEVDERDREAAREIQRQFALVKAREKARVEALRATKVVPHEESPS